MVDYASRAAGRARRRETTDVASFVRRLDWVLIGSVGALVGYGLWAIADITRHDVQGNAQYYVTRQALYVTIGVICLLVAVLVDPDLYRTRWRFIFGGTAGVIALVLLTGPIRGSKRWLDLGFFRFQPSEFGKVLFVLALAGFLAERGRRIGDPRTTLSIVGLASIPIFLVFLQPDFGSALVYCAAVGAVLLVAGTPWTHIGAVAAAAVTVAALVLGVLPAAGVPVLKHYQEQRLTGFLNPTSDPGGTTYNITQSKNAIGAGQVRGRGPDNATQTTLNFLPEHHTDFVFASLRGTRLPRGGLPAAALSARRLARLTDRHPCPRPVLRDRRGWAGRRAAVPDLRQRRHDDGDRADHRHPAPVRQRRRLVDDLQPDRGRALALDSRARPWGAPLIRPPRRPASASPGGS